MKGYIDALGLQTGRSTRWTVPIPAGPLRSTLTRVEDPIPMQLSLRHPLLRRVLPLMLVLLPLAVIAQAAPPDGYQLPPPPLQALVDAPVAPQPSLSPRRDLLALVQSPTLPGIDVVAQPELKLAGLRINPRSYSQSRFSFGTDLWLQDIASGREMRVQGLPSTLSIASSAWSPDQRHIAFNQLDAASGGNELWLVEVATLRARKLLSQPLNTVTGRGYSWMPDSRSLLVQVRPQGQGQAPVAQGVPTGPSVQETGAGGRVIQIRNYQDMLRNEADAKLLEHYLRSQTL